MAATTSDGELDIYVRTVTVPTKSLTERKRGLLNRQMKHSLRAARYTADYLQQPGVSAHDFTIKNRGELRKEISNQPKIDLDSHAIQCAIVTVVQNYEEYEKSLAANAPQPENATSVAYSAQRTFLFHNSGSWYLSLPAKNGHLILPLAVSDDEYHQQILPDPSAAPDSGRRPGVSLNSFAPSDFERSVVGLGQCSVVKTECDTYTVHFSVKREKKVKRNVSEPRFVVGVDRGRNQLYYAALYDRKDDHVLDWAHMNGAEIEDKMDKLADRISQFQSDDALDEMQSLRQRRRRYKRQKDYEAANAVVDLAREARRHNPLEGENVTIVLEELTGMSRLGGWSKERRRFNEWSYYRQEKAIEDKAEPYDIPVETVEPSFTSQDCSRCSSDDTRRSGVHFKCRDCGYQQHADANAAVNIAKRYAE